MTDARYVFHAVTIDDEQRRPDPDVIERATRECTRLAHALGLRSIAFPALGTGVGGFPFQPAATSWCARSPPASTRRPASSA
jgi:O-acetyl-ADP-ribose deacetylase (regulator of RNase III)